MTLTIIVMIATTCGSCQILSLSWCQFAEGSKCLSKCFVGRVDQVEEAVLIHLISIKILDCDGDRGQGCLINKKKEGLGWMQLETTPDDLYQLSHRDMVRDQKLCLVEHREALLPRCSLNNTGHL